MKNKLNLTFGAVLLASVVLTGCTVGPDYETPDAPVPSAYKNGSSKAEGSACREDWWKIFNDTQLNKLVDAAHGQNRSLRASFQRVQQARSTIRVTRADLFPQIDTAADFNHSETSSELDFGNTAGFQNRGRTTSTYSLPVNAAWEIDLFGRVRRSTEASTADAQAQEEEFAAMRLSVEADLASTYFRIRALDREINLVAESVSLRQDSVKLVKERFDQGVVGELDLAQAKTQLSQSKAEIAALRRQRSQYENALALLIGAPASGFSLGSRPLSGTPPRVPSGLPSELLRARPDIRVAERNMAAAGARIGVATAEFYPSITLVGNVGVSASEVGNLFQSSAGAWVINPSVSLPIFQGFRNKANLERAEAAFEESRETYEGTILTAISEVETNLAAWKHLRVQTNAQSEAVRSAKRARALTTEQYDAGLVDYLFVLDAERTALTTERALATLTGDDYVNSVNLIRSLGGRW
ncbi:MAG: efflux transporter outer membrane subunit [Verrucomicrobiales bacterium]|nr:efflux transporter outer membrane subunit [Verrucomicrobiales bacterium]